MPLFIARMYARIDQHAQPAHWVAPHEYQTALAFRSSLSTGRNILALVDHDATRVLCRTKTGTLKLLEDSSGVAFELNVPDTAVGRDVLKMAGGGDLGGMIFGFNVTDEDWQGTRRELRGV